MHCKKLLTYPTDTVYVYDGSLAGFYCCVHESIYGKEMPFAISREGDGQGTLFFRRQISTDTEKAQRVRSAVAGKISLRALQLVETVFLSCLEEKELALLHFLLTAFKTGAETVNMLAHPDVTPLINAEKHLLRERHLLTGFVRFTDDNGTLVATITPKNYILPFIANHFADRFHNERFIIYDKTHQAGLFYQDGNMEIVELEGVEFGQISETEAHYRALWKQFYNTIGIKGRYNPKCRMGHMPKRYWENMTEMQDLL